MKKEPAVSFVTPIFNEEGIIALFLGILSLGIVYAIRKKFLVWK